MIVKDKNEVIACRT